MPFLPALPRISERAFMAQVVTLARLFKWRVFHDNATNAPRACPHCHGPLTLPRNVAGFPDLLMLRSGTLWVVECKSDRGKPTADQEDWLADFRAVERVRVAIWRPRDWERIERLLR